jgi:hypothetical protein
MAIGGVVSAALSLGSPRVAVNDLPALWSPDFPPAGGGCPPAILRPPPTAAKPSNTTGFKGIPTPSDDASMPEMLNQDARVLFLLALGLGFGLLWFGGGFKRWRRLRLFQDTPTSKVRSMAMGRVEVHGNAEGKAALEAPFTGASCVWFRWTVEEEVRRNRRTSWKSVATGGSDAWPFYLEDETGSVLVDPRGAEVEIPIDYRSRRPERAQSIAAFLEGEGIATRGFLGWKRKLRFTEWHIAPGEEIYVLGFAQERANLVAERRRRITEKVMALKSDPETMAHLDLDGDGHVSADEWEAARSAVVREVEFGVVEDRVVIAGDPEGSAPFYLADRHEAAIVASHRWQAALGVFGGAGLSLGCLAGLLNAFGVL